VALEICPQAVVQAAQEALEAQAQVAAVVAQAEVEVQDVNN